MPWSATAVIALTASPSRESAAGLGATPPWSGGMGAPQFGARSKCWLQMVEPESSMWSRVDSGERGKACFPALSYNDSIWVGITTGVSVIRTALDQNIGMSKSFCNVRDRVECQPPPQFCALQKLIWQEAQQVRFAPFRTVLSRFEPFSAGLEPFWAGLDRFHPF